MSLPHLSFADGWSSTLLFSSLVFSSLVFSSLPFPSLLCLCVSLSQPTRTHGHELCLCEHENMNPSVGSPKTSPISVSFWYNHTLFKKVDVQWRSLSAPGSWQQISVTISQSKSTLNPMVNNGERGSQHMKDKGNSKIIQRSGQAWCSRPRKGF